MSDSIQVEALAKGDKAKQIEVKLNNATVVFYERELTGLEFKQAAIAQGVSIQPDFVLQEKRPNGEYVVIGDDDALKLRPRMEFTAIAPDDNS